jgi:hypothetical protein
MNNNEQIEKDLRLLASEAKKKYVTVRDSATSAINNLRSNRTIPVDSLLRVLETVKGTGQPKLVAISLALLQKLMNFRVLDGSSLVSAIQFLQAVGVESVDENVQLRTVQTLMLILNPQHLHLSTDLVEEVWKLSMQMTHSRSPFVRNASAATIRQLITVTVDKLDQYSAILADTASQQGQDTVEARTVYDSALNLLRHIVELSKGSHALWGGNTNKSVTEGLELLAILLQSSKSFLKHLPEIQKLIDTVVSSQLQTYLTDLRSEEINVRSVQCGVLVIMSSGINSDIILSIINLIDNKRITDPLKHAALEGIASLIWDTDLLVGMFEKGNLLSKLLEGLNNIVHSSYSTTDEVKLQASREKIKIVVEIISHLIDSFIRLMEKQEITLGEFCPFPLKDNQMVCEDILTAVWKPVLPILSMVVSNTWEESMLQVMLNCYQSLINISGTLNHYAAREAFLNSISQFCLPTHNQTLALKNIYTCKTLFNVAHCLGTILDVKSWHRVLDTLNKLDYILATTPKQEDDTHSDLQILASALESLFSNTHKWSDQGLLDLISALGQLTLEFMESIATSEKKAPGMKVFGLEKMIVVAEANLYRITLFWEILSPYLDCICISKYPEVRVAGIKNLTRLIIKVFKYFVENPPESELDKWKNWQGTLFLSLHDLSGSSFADTQEAVLESIYSILQTCGGQLDRTGWSMLILILSRLDTSANSQAGFKSIKLIVNDFLQSEHLLPCLERLITCISKFAHNSEDLNVAITSVGMYWNLADYLGRVGKDKEDIWWIILKELKTLGEDPRPEVRHSAIHSLHVALTTHGQCLSHETWQKVMTEIILFLLQKISSTYFRNATIAPEVPVVVDQPTFVNQEDSQPPSKKDWRRKNLQIAIPTVASPIVTETPKFAGSTGGVYKGDKIVVHHSRDTEEKQWEETYHIFTQNLGKLFRTYLSNLKGANNDQIIELPEVRKNWDILILRLKEGIHNGTTNIILAVLKAVKELLSSHKVSRLLFSKWNSSWEIFSTLCQRLQVSSTNIQQKLITMILEDLHLIYSSSQTEPFSERCIQELFVLIRFLLKSCKSDAAVLASCKLLPEEREIFEFMEKLAGYILKNKYSLTPYLYFLLDFCRYDNQDTHSDAICRKALSVLEQVASLSHESLLPVISPILNTYKALITARFDNETMLLMNVSCKGSSPLWYVSEESYINILPHIIKLDCWEGLLSLLESIISPPEGALAQMSRNNLEEIVKLGESMDIKLIEFVKKEMIPISMTKSAALQWRLVSLLDSGCNNYYRAFHSQELSMHNSLSSVCLSGLFELSRAQTHEKEDEIENLSVKIAKRTTPVLISKCQDLLKKFANEEKLLGQMPLPKGRIFELLEVLENLRTFEIPEGVLERPGKKAHLIELFPQLCELITAKEQEVKESLKQVFLEIANQLKS